MWSRLTEYAGTVAEIVAPPTSEDGEEDEDHSKAQLGDELWSRFANIVAPTDENAPPGSSNGKSSMYKGEAVEEDDDDEQERYISELERALLHKKKQNELLEEKIRALEEHGKPSLPTDAESGSLNTSALVQEKDEEIERLRAELEKVTSQTDVSRLALDTERAAAQQRAQEEAECLRGEVATLQQRVMELQVANATLREDREATPRKSNEEMDEQKRDVDAETVASPQRVSMFPTLVQATLVLSKIAPGSSSLEVGTTESAVAAQLAELCDQVRSRVSQSESQFAQLHAALVSFCGMHGEKIDESQGDAFCAEVQATLGLLSHRLSKGAADAQELHKLQQQLQTMHESDQKHQRTILALQTQLSGVQASKLKNDASLASRESDMMAAVEKRDQKIMDLQASEEQLRQSLVHLGKVLEDSHGEIDELEKFCRDQQQELSKLQRRDEQANDLQIAYDELQSRVHELEKSAHEYEQGYVELLQEAEAVKRKTEEEKAELVATTEAQVSSTEKQMLYDLQARLSACEADKLVAVQDAERLQTELDALDKVLLQFRSDHKQQRERLLELEQTLEETRKTSRQQERNAATANTGSAASGVISEHDFRRVMEVLAKRTQECDQLREALENAAKRFSKDSELLDKSLAAQLVVSYLESDKKDEVLQLMSRMMGFSEEQKRRAGVLGDGHVVIPGNGGGGLFSSIFGIQSATSQSHDDTALAATQTSTDEEANVNVTDLWTNFLIDEAKNGEKGSNVMR